MSLTGLALRRRLSFVFAQVVALTILADWLFIVRRRPHIPPAGFDDGAAAPLTAGHAYPDAVAAGAEFLAPAGVNVVIFCAALLTAILCRGNAAWRSWPGRLLLVAMAGLIFAMLRAPSILAIMMSGAGLAALAIVDRQGWTASAALGARELASFGFDALKRPLRDAHAAQRWSRTRREHAGTFWSSGAMAVRWMLPLGLSAVFIGLFAVANPVIVQWFTHLPMPSAMRIVLWVIMALGAWGLLRARARSASPERAPEAAAPAGFERFAGWDWITRSLILFNAIFAVQTSLDVLYLIYGADLPDGMTYAQYAHRGAYPLIVAALLAGWFVLIAFRPGGLAEHHTPTRRLVQLWIMQTLLLTLSAMWRLALYVEAYSLTLLRASAAIWMLLVAIGLALLIVRIARGLPNRWLLNATSLATACVLYTCCFVDFRHAIADHNVRHCREIASLSDPSLETQRAPLDIAYLEQLGPPALPALHRYVDARAADNDAAHQRAAAREAIRRLEYDLEDQLSNWRGWTLARAALMSSRSLHTCR